MGLEALFVLCIVGWVSGMLDPLPSSKDMVKI